MEWKDIRQHCPEQWVLVEAVEAHTEGNMRIVDSLALINTFADSVTALQAYKQLHRASPLRELYVAHTSRMELEITERVWLGILPGYDFKPQHYSRA